MTKRDLSDRFSGQFLGSAWAVIHPLATVAVFLFIFGVVFKVKVSSIDFPADHAVYMVSGLIPWLVAADVFSRATGAISSQAALVKQVVFPLEVLPTKTALATLPTMLIGYAGLIIYLFVSFGSLAKTFFLLPVLIAVFYFFLIGLAYLFSAVGVFFRDLKDVIQLYVLLGMYLAPIFYFLEWIPERFRPIIFLNPLTYFVSMFHDIAYYGEITSRLTWIIGGALAALSFVIGTAVFTRLKPHFGSFL